MLAFREAPHAHTDFAIRRKCLGVHAADQVFGPLQVDVAVRIVRAGGVAGDRHLAAQLEGIGAFGFVAVNAAAVAASFVLGDGKPVQGKCFLKPNAGAVCGGIPSKAALVRGGKGQLFKGIQAAAVTFGGVAVDARCSIERDFGGTVVVVHTGAVGRCRIADDLGVGERDGAAVVVDVHAAAVGGLVRLDRRVGFHVKRCHIVKVDAAAVVCGGVVLDGGFRKRVGGAVVAVVHAAAVFADGVFGDGGMVFQLHGAVFGVVVDAAAAAVLNAVFGDS